MDSDPFCLSLRHVPCRQSSEDLSESSWLLSSPLVSSLDGSLSARAEQYLKIMLARHDDAATFWRYHEAVLEKLLEYDRRLPLPSWLVDFFAVSSASCPCFFFSFYLSKVDGYV